MAGVGKITLDLINWPEGLAMVRSELAKMLREEADSDADPRIARKLREIAARFEAGQ
jgi:PHD/YefM family antitoxin component YafN of YafNO toxin-antitoxin module